MRAIAVTAAELQATVPLWLPFLPAISRRSKETVRAMYGQVMRREVKITLAWDDEINKPVALAGVRFHMRGPDLIAEWCWMTGRDHKQWLGLLPEFENMVRLAGATELRVIGRPGWARVLKPRGYKFSHVVMEKIL